MFSVRIVTTDHYTAPPVKGLDVLYSDLRGSQVSRVPVLRIFGSTSSGQKTCLHVHGVFPYICIPYENKCSTDPKKDMRQMAGAIDRAINMSMGKASCLTQHVYKITLVSGMPFYGYHSSERDFLKIFFYNPVLVKRAVELLQAGAINGQVYQPYEAHVPYSLQFFMDYNLYGMNYMKLASINFRRPDNMAVNKTEDYNKQTQHNLHSSDAFVSNDESSRWNLSNIPYNSSLWLGEDTPKTSTCELEADALASDILNRSLETDEKFQNPGLIALWEDERQRRQAAGVLSVLTQPESQDRDQALATDSDCFFQGKIREILELHKLLFRGMDDSQLVNSHSFHPPATAVNLHHSQHEDTTSIKGESEIEEDQMFVDEDLVHSVANSSILSTQQSTKKKTREPSNEEIVHLLMNLSDGTPGEDCVLSGETTSDAFNGDGNNDVHDNDEAESIIMSQPVWDCVSDEESGDVLLPFGQAVRGNTSVSSEYDSADILLLPQLDGPIDVRVKKAEQSSSSLDSANDSSTPLDSEMAEVAASSAGTSALLNGSFNDLTERKISASSLRSNSGIELFPGASTISVIDVTKHLLSPHSSLDNVPTDSSNVVTQNLLDDAQSTTETSVSKAPFSTPFITVSSSPGSGGSTQIKVMPTVSFSNVNCHKAVNPVSVTESVHFSSSSKTNVASSNISPAVLPTIKVVSAKRLGQQSRILLLSNGQRISVPNNHNIPIGSRIAVTTKSHATKLPKNCSTGGNAQTQLVYPKSTLNTMLVKPMQNKTKNSNIYPAIEIRSSIEPEIPMEYLKADDSAKELAIDADDKSEVISLTKVQQFITRDGIQWDHDYCIPVSQRLRRDTFERASESSNEIQEAGIGKESSLMYNQQKCSSKISLPNTILNVRPLTSKTSKFTSNFSNASPTQTIITTRFGTYGISNKDLPEISARSQLPHSRNQIVMHTDTVRGVIPSVSVQKSVTAASAQLGSSKQKQYDTTDESFSGCHNLLDTLSIDVGATNDIEADLISAAMTAGGLHAVNVTSAANEAPFASVAKQSEQVICSPRKNVQESKEAASGRVAEPLHPPIDPVVIQPLKLTISTKNICKSSSDDKYQIANETEEIKSEYFVDMKPTKQANSNLKKSDRHKFSKSRKTSTKEKADSELTALASACSQLMAIAANMSTRKKPTLTLSSSKQRRKREVQKGQKCQSKPPKSWGRNQRYCAFCRKTHDENSDCDYVDVDEIEKYGRNKKESSHFPASVTDSSSLSTSKASDDSELDDKIVDQENSGNKTDDFWSVGDRNETVQSPNHLSSHLSALHPDEPSELNIVNSEFVPDVVASYEIIVAETFNSPTKTANAAFPENESCASSSSNHLLCSSTGTSLTQRLYESVTDLVEEYDSDSSTSTIGYSYTNPLSKVQSRSYSQSVSADDETEEDLEDASNEQFSKPNAEENSSCQLKAQKSCFEIPHHISLLSATQIIENSDPVSKIVTSTSTEVDVRYSGFSSKQDFLLSEGLEGNSEQNEQNEIVISETQTNDVTSQVLNEEKRSEREPPNQAYAFLESSADQVGHVPDGISSKEICSKSPVDEVVVSIEINKQYTQLLTGEVVEPLDTLSGEEEDTLEISNLEYSNEFDLSPSTQHVSLLPSTGISSPFCQLPSHIPKGACIVYPVNPVVLQKNDEPSKTCVNNSSEATLSDIAEKGSDILRKRQEHDHMSSVQNKCDTRDTIAVPNQISMKRKFTKHSSAYFKNMKSSRIDCIKETSFVQNEMNTERHLLKTKPNSKNSASLLKDMCTDSKRETWKDSEAFAKILRSTFPRSMRKRGMTRNLPNGKNNKNVAYSSKRSSEHLSDNQEKTYVSLKEKGKYGEDVKKELTQNQLSNHAIHDTRFRGKQSILEKLGMTLKKRKSKTDIQKRTSESFPYNSHDKPLGALCKPCSVVVEKLVIESGGLPRTFKRKRHFTLEYCDWLEIQKKRKRRLSEKTKVTNDKGTEKKKDKIASKAPLQFVISPVKQAEEKQTDIDKTAPVKRVLVGKKKKVSPRKQQLQFELRYSNNNDSYKKNVYETSKANLSRSQKRLYSVESNKCEVDVSTHCKIVHPQENLNEPNLNKPINPSLTSTLEPEAIVQVGTIVNQGICTITDAKGSKFQSSPTVDVIVESDSESCDIPERTCSINSNMLACYDFRADNALENMAFWSPYSSCHGSESPPVCKSPSGSVSDKDDITELLNETLRKSLILLSDATSTDVKTPGEFTSCEKHVGPVAAQESKTIMSKASPNDVSVYKLMEGDVLRIKTQELGTDTRLIYYDEMPNSADMKLYVSVTPSKSCDEIASNSSLNTNNLFNEPDDVKTSQSHLTTMNLPTENKHTDNLENSNTGVGNLMEGSCVHSVEQRHLIHENGQKREKPEIKVKGNKHLFPCNNFGVDADLFSSILPVNVCASSYYNSVKADAVSKYDSDVNAVVKSLIDSVSEQHSVPEKLNGRHSDRSEVWQFTFPASGILRQGLYCAENFDSVSKENEAPNSNYSESENDWFALKNMSAFSIHSTFEKRAENTGDTVLVPSLVPRDSRIRVEECLAECELNRGCSEETSFSDTENNNSISFALGATDHDFDLSDIVPESPEASADKNYEPLNQKSAGDLFCSESHGDMSCVSYNHSDELSNSFLSGDIFRSYSSEKWIVSKKSEVYDNVSISDSVYPEKTNFDDVDCLIVQDTNEEFETLARSYVHDEASRINADEPVVSTTNSDDINDSAAITTDDDCAMEIDSVAASAPSADISSALQSIVDKVAQSHQAEIDIHPDGITEIRGESNPSIPLSCIDAHSSTRNSKTYRPAMLPPSRRDVVQSLKKYGLSAVRHQEAFCSDSSDIPSKPREIGGRLLEVKSTCVGNLRHFDTGNTEITGLTAWRVMLNQSSSSSFQLAQHIQDNPLLRGASLPAKPVVITPCVKPPSRDDVDKWLKINDKGFVSTNAGKDDDSDDDIGDSQNGRTDVEKHLNSSISDHSALLDATAEPVTTARDGGGHMENGEKLKTLTDEMLISPERGVPLIERTEASPLFGTTANSQQEVDHCTSVKAVHSTPARISLAVFSANVTPISKLPTSQTNVEESINFHDPMGKMSNANLEPEKMQHGYSLKRILIGNQTKEMSPAKHCHGSGIDAVTPNNTHGFRVSRQDLQEAKAVHEAENLTVMTMELYCHTRGELCPDPTMDTIGAIFYCIQNDTGNTQEQIMKGMIIVATSTPNNHWTLSKCGVTSYNVVYCENEMAAFDVFLDIVQRSDPDILVGYEIQTTSWGYLMHRAAHLGVNLCARISRVPDSTRESRFDAESDEWGANHMSEIHIAGRIVLNLWRILRHEVTLNVYSFENVAYHVLHTRIPLFNYRQLTRWFQHESNIYRWRVIEHYMTRVCSEHQIMKQLDLISRTSELARLFGIEFYDVLSRGSQFRVESMMLRMTRAQNYIALSPSVQQRARMKAPECLPLNMEPESRFYTDPVIVLDFQSLYPSMMIAYNYCFSTCVGRVNHLQHIDSEIPYELGCYELTISPTDFWQIRNHLTISPNGVVFVKKSVREGILPRMLKEILDSRIMVKDSLKKHKGDRAAERLLHARQLGLKLIANVTYGYTSANFSGRMPCVDVADSIVRKGRETLERAIKLVEENSKWNARVVYGDTDSMFLLLAGRSKEEAFRIGQEIADEVTAQNPKPVKLKFEKVYLPCVLQTKKRYVGYAYESIEQTEPVFDAKGIETVRRDGCPAAAKILERSLKVLFTTKDVSRVRQYVQCQFTKFMEGKVSILDCLFAKEYRGMNTYRPGACVPSLHIARKRLSVDPCSEPRRGERVPYLIVYGSPGLPLIKLVREPHEMLQDPTLRINTIYYITRQVLPPLDRIFSLIGVDVRMWYSNMPRIERITSFANEKTNKKGTIAQYFEKLECPACGMLTLAHSLCPNCTGSQQMVAAVLGDKIARLERTYQDLRQVCISCSGWPDFHNECASLDCPILFRLSKSWNDMNTVPSLRSLLASVQDSL